LSDHDKFLIERKTRPDLPDDVLVALQLFSSTHEYFSTRCYRPHRRWFDRAHRMMPTDGGPALMFALPIAAAFGFAVARIKEDEKFLVRLFISAIMVRIFLGSVIYYFHQQEFFGADANTFDIFGNAL